MESQGGLPLRIGERILVSFRDDDVWHERLLVTALTDKSWLIVTPGGDLYSEKVLNCDGPLAAKDQRDPEIHPDSLAMTNNPRGALCGPLGLG